ncbi:hypothetical protein DHEL01_v209884 [Diaporthe helianthi]|uniref:Uncharacterized protein n=1 Tax=Diaporthe helianthi TaxID=158607 RepID=A0A2P5HN89_DIAHE|nr:hypothetical protein DHEL01_v209884 [Diaporthe helianthi]
MFRVSKADAPTLRLVAIESPFTLSRPFNPAYTLTASCLSQATQSAYRTRAQALMQHVVKRACMRTRMEIPPQASN